MRSEIGHGVATWSAAWWRESAVAWLDVELARAGSERTGELAQRSLRPWATVLRVPMARSGSRRPGLYGRLQRELEPHVDAPLQTLASVLDESYLGEA
jgi:hypothetical protein